MIITMRDCVLPLPLIIATSHHTIKFLITVTLLQLAMNIDLFSSLLHVNFAAALITQPTKEVNIIITSAWETSPVSVEHSTSHFLNKYIIMKLLFNLTIITLQSKMYLCLQPAFINLNYWMIPVYCGFLCKGIWFVIMRANCSLCQAKVKILITANITWWL